MTVRNTRLKRGLKIIVIAAVIIVLGISVWTERTSAVGIPHSFALHWIPYTVYETPYKVGEQKQEKWKIRIHSVDGMRQLDYMNSAYTAKLGEIFTYGGDNSYLNEAQGKLLLRISDPDVISLAEHICLREKEMIGEKNTEIPVYLYPKKEGAAELYVDEVKDDDVTTLGKVEVEIMR